MHVERPCSPLRGSGPSRGSSQSKDDEVHGKKSHSRGSRGTSDGEARPGSPGGGLQGSGSTAMLVDPPPPPPQQQPPAAPAAAKGGAAAAQQQQQGSGADSAGSGGTAVLHSALVPARRSQPNTDQLHVRRATPRRPAAPEAVPSVLAPYEKHLAQLVGCGHASSQLTTWQAMLLPLQNLVELRLLGYEAVPPPHMLATMQCLPALRLLDLRTQGADLAGSSDMPISQSSSSSRAAANFKCVCDAHLEALAGLTSLTVLHLSNVTAVTAAGLAHLHALSLLRSLSLCDALSGRNILAGNLQALAAALPSLQCLAVGRTVPFPVPQMGGAPPPSWGNALAHFANLRYLGLQFVHCLDEPVLGHMPQLTRLKVLDLEGLDLSYGEIMVMLAAVQHIPALRHLRLSGVVLYDTHLSSIASLTNLRQLSLQQVDVWTRDLSGWTCLAPLTALTRFEFQEWNNPILSVGNLAVLTDESVGVMASNWLNLRELRYLGKVQLTGQSRRALASLPQLSQLRIIGPDGTCCVGSHPRAAALTVRPGAAQQPTGATLPHGNNAPTRGLASPNGPQAGGDGRAARWDAGPDGSHGGGNGSNHGGPAMSARGRGAPTAPSPAAAAEAAADAAVREGLMQCDDDDDGGPSGDAAAGGLVSGGGSGGGSGALTVGEQQGEAGAGGLQVRLLLPRAKLSSCNGYLAHSGTPSLDGSEGSEDSVNWDGPEDILDDACNKAVTAVGAGDNEMPDTQALFTEGRGLTTAGTIQGGKAAASGVSDAAMAAPTAGNGMHVKRHEEEGGVPFHPAGAPGAKRAKVAWGAVTAGVAGDTAPKRAREVVADLPAQLLQMKTQRAAASLGMAVQRPASSATCDPPHATR